METYLHHLHRVFITFLYMVHNTFSLILSPLFSAVCCHHLSPRIAIVLLLLTSAPYFSMPHLSFFFSSPLTHFVSFRIFHISPLCAWLLPLLLDCRHASFFSRAGPGPLHEIVVSAPKGGEVVGRTNTESTRNTDRPVAQLSAPITQITARN